MMSLPVDCSPRWATIKHVESWRSRHTFQVYRSQNVRCAWRSFISDIMSKLLQVIQSLVIWMKQLSLVFISALKVTPKKHTGTLTIALTHANDRYVNEKNLHERSFKAVYPARSLKTILSFNNTCWLLLLRLEGLYLK